MHLESLHVASSIANVANVGVGTDDLISTSLPANFFGPAPAAQIIRIFAWGSTANNANAKTVTLNFGTDIPVTTALTASIAGQWSITAIVTRTGVSTQDIVAYTLQGATVIYDQEQTAATQVETAAITVKCTGNATADGDIDQAGLLIERIR
mgnify:FL=1